MSNEQNLRPWQKGVSGNPGGRPKRMTITAELERLLDEEAPRANGKTWAAVIALALLTKARKGDVRAISEIANRLEGKPRQAIEMDVDATSLIIERLHEGRARVAAHREAEEAQRKLES